MSRPKVVPFPVPGKSGVDTGDLIADAVALAEFPGRQLEALVLAVTAVAVELRALRAAVEREGRRGA